MSHLDGRLEHGQFLMIAERRRFAGGPTDHQALGASVEQGRRQTLGLVEVQRPARLVERGDHRREQTSELPRHACTSCPCRAAGDRQPLRATNSKTWIALRAAPFLRLSLTTHNARPRAWEGSWRMRPT